MERPSPNQLPPEYTGPEAPVANPEMLEQQDLRYGMMELTGNIQKIIESGNEEAVGDYLKEVIDGNNESVSPNERRAAFELLATSEAKRIDQQTIEYGEEMLVNGATSTDRLLQEQEQSRNRLRVNMNDVEDVFNSRVKRPVLFEERFDQIRIRSAQDEMTDRLRSSSRTINDHEEVYGNWGMQVRGHTEEFLQTQEGGNTKKARLADVSEKLKEQSEEVPEALDKLFDDSTLSSVATELVGLSNGELDDGAIEIIIEKLGVESDKDTQNITHALKSLAEHAHQESRTVAVSIESAARDLKGNIGRIIRTGEELTYGSSNRRIVDAQELVHGQARYLNSTVGETDQMLSFGERKALNLAKNFQGVKNELAEYLSRQSQLEQQDKK